eukprot:g33722.t1
MQKISNKMGGVPSQALRNAERIRKTPLTLQEACKFGDLRAVQRYLSETEAAVQYFLSEYSNCNLHNSTVRLLLK